MLRKKFVFGSLVAATAAGVLLTGSPADAGSGVSRTVAVQSQAAPGEVETVPGQATAGTAVFSDHHRRYHRRHHRRHHRHYRHHRHHRYHHRHHRMHRRLHHRH